MSENLLQILKFSGPVVGLASALWSTTQKITYEGADGGKRLTLQGRLMVGIDRSSRFPRGADTLVSVSIHLQRIRALFSLAGFTDRG